MPSRRALDFSVVPPSLSSRVQEKQTQFFIQSFDPLQTLHTMALASMYQRIPYSILSQVNKKKPQNYAICKLPTTNANNPHDPSVASFETARSMSSKGGGLRETAFARWETVTFPKDIDFERALEAIEVSNSKEPRVLKYKLTFADGCHILLTRSNWEDHSTLYCTEAYDPNGAFHKMTNGKKDDFAATEGKKRATALADVKGHLKDRKRLDDGSPLNHSFAAPQPKVGAAGYAFTPMSYVSHEVRPNKNFPGVRPGLRETNRTAHQFLKKDDNM